MQVCTLLQTDNHTSIPPLRVKALKAKALKANELKIIYYLIINCITFCKLGPWNLYFM